jgi:GT2 family glycosyltransferase
MFVAPGEPPIRCHEQYGSLPRPGHHAAIPVVTRRSMVVVRLWGSLRLVLGRLKALIAHSALTRHGRLARRVRARKRARAASPFTYSEAPRMALVVQSFNHRRNIAGIVARVRQTTAEEFIVCEDGSIDGSDHVWRAALDRPNDFVILSNDLHEIRTYNRAISLARAEFVGVMQDDDIPPADPAWVTDAIALLRAQPRLAVLGCWNGWAHDYDDPERLVLTHVGEGMNYAVGEVVHPVPTRDPHTNVPFCFIESVGVGPLFVRRAVFEELGGFDAALSAPGESGIWLDYELCVRAWLAGYQVGLYESAPFARNVGGQGTIVFAPESRDSNYLRNRAIVGERYRGRIAPVRAAIEGLNQGLTPRTMGA